MDRIKASQQKVQGPSYKEPGSHFTGQPSQWFIFEFFIHWSGHFICLKKNGLFHYSHIFEMFCGLIFVWVELNKHRV